MGAMICGLDGSDSANEATRVARVLGARRFIAEDELTELLWAITAINAWNRISIAT
jgi:alkylhydroperoxidase family enzyme